MTAVACATLMPPVTIDYWGQTHVGHIRQSNEDAFEIVPELGLLVVADGMGGAAAGERASALAVKTVVSEARAAGPDLTAAMVDEAIELANRSIRLEAECDPALRGMGTTVTAALVRGETTWVVNIGDSRAYRLSGDHFAQLTTDHSWLEEYGGDLTPEQIRSHPYRHVLTRALGVDPVAFTDTSRVPFGAGDILLLCSDGLHSVVSDETIVELLAHEASLQERASALIDAALEGGGPDNVTVALAIWTEDSEAP